MAVDDFVSRETDAFVLPSKSYYPLKIPIAHYQLRHFISSPELDIIYYASGCDLYCLNAATRTQARVYTLPWDARATAAGHGYVCVGGANHGNLAVIKVSGFPPTEPAAVDALLPLDLNNRLNLPRPPLLGAAYNVVFNEIGDDIINSITIHKFPAELDGQEEVVAVLTNNDMKLRVYSLTQDKQLDVLDLPFPMNHATISPDGQILVAVGDQHIGYFFQRVTKKKSALGRAIEDDAHSHVGWKLLQEVVLYVPPGAGLEGYFTTAWSPSGRLCALGSECGYITVFDVELLKRCEYGEDAVIQILRSTRPDVNIAGPGAVRTMQFSPAPWDFLIWSEDQARVCVADVRSGMKVKQVLDLNPKEEGVEKVEIADFKVELSPGGNDVSQDADLIRRYRQLLDTQRSIANTDDAFSQHEPSRFRHHRLHGVVHSDDDPHGLTTQERMVLEALRNTRQRDGAHEQSPVPRSINYNTSAQARRERDGAARRNMADTFTEFMSESARQLHQRQERMVALRQGSVVVDGITSVNNGTAHPNITGRITTRSPNPISAVVHQSGTATQARADNNDIVASTDDAWRTIEDALGRNREGVAEAARAAAPTAELRNDLRRIRQLTQMRERLRSAREAQGQLVEAYSSAVNSYRPRSRSHHNPADGLRTAGLAMSPDGRILYCGTEEGIFEFHIDLHPRKGLPAITPR